MRSASALTGRTTDRVTQSASASAASSATIVMTRIRRVPELAAERAFWTPVSANACDASIRLDPAFSTWSSRLRICLL
jgi:hypothetical protein